MYMCMYEPGYDFTVPKHSLYVLNSDVYVCVYVLYVHTFMYVCMYKYTYYIFPYVVEYKLTFLIDRFCPFHGIWQTIGPTPTRSKSNWKVC